MTTTTQEHRLVIALVPLEKVDQYETSMGDDCAFVTVKWSENSIENQKAVTEGIHAMNSAYCAE